MSRDDSCRVLDLDLTGGDYLWSIALTNPIEELASEAGALLMKSFGSLSQRVEENTLYFVEACFKRIRSLKPTETLQQVDEDSEAPDDSVGAAAAPEKTASAGSAEIAAGGNSVQNALELRTVQRCVGMLGLYVEKQQENHAISYRQEYFPHYLGGYVPSDRFTHVFFPCLPSAQTPTSRILCVFIHSR